MLNSARASLLDDKRLVGQSIGLERRTSRAGKESIDHAPGSHDDFANAVAGAVCLATDCGQVVPIMAPIVVTTSRSSIGDPTYGPGDISRPGGWPADQAPDAAPFWKP